MKEYKTTDLAIASLFKYFGHSPYALERDDRGRTVFYFEHSDELESLHRKFYNGDLSVEPSKFFSIIKEVKNLLYNQYEATKTETKKE